MIRIRAVWAVLCLAAIVGCADSSPRELEAARDESRAAVRRFWQTHNEATALRVRREYAAAAAAYERALADDPLHEDSLYYLGHCMSHLGRTDQARATFAKLVSVNPDSARGHLALGALLSTPEESRPLEAAAAEAHLRRAHEINGEETGPMMRLGELLIVQGHLEEAGAWLEAAARTNPKSVEAAFLAGYLRWEAGDFAGAREFYLKAVAAAKVDAPVKGVLSEGDRKPAPSDPAGRLAAPPLESPMGRTLFEALCAPARGQAVVAPGSPGALEDIYAPVRDLARRLARRLV